MSYSLTRKAYYNHLCFTKEGGPTTWQNREYRDIATQELLNRLDELLTISGPWNEALFIENAATFDTPEDMSDYYTQNLIRNLPQECDEIYLVIFELWRRLCSHMASLSLLTDELDHLMIYYSRQKGRSDPHLTRCLFDELAQLQSLLELHLDEGMTAQQAVAIVQSNLACPLMDFLYLFILDQIEKADGATATELLDGYAAYLPSDLWFSYLSARAELLTDPISGAHRLEAILSALRQTPDFDLMIEILNFLATSGHATLFHLFFAAALPLATKEADFVELLEVAKQHLAELKLYTELSQIKTILKMRKNREPTFPLDKKDADFITLGNLIGHAHVSCL